MTLAEPDATAMEYHHREDMRQERLLRDAVRALDALEDVSRVKGSPAMTKRVDAARSRLVAMADHIVAVWD